MKFTKLQGAGNDFLLIEAGNMQRNWSQLARAMCDRHFGIGADGLLVLLPSDAADFQMREFNPDGSESESCGNGLRCLVKYVMDKKLVDTATREVSIKTVSGVRKFKADNSQNETAEIQISMGAPKFETEDIPAVLEPGKGQIVDIKLIKYPIIVDGNELFLNLISMGNPHAVYFWDKPVSDFPLSQLGPKIEKHKMFPGRTNFEVARVVDKKQIEARVWERGVGETLACGSGACAIAVAARLNGYVNSKVDIIYPGGTLTVEWDGKGEAFLSGPTEIVFMGEWPE
ncbi:Diaminopimelate epimerase [subsurface metagenome]